MVRLGSLVCFMGFFRLPKGQTLLNEVLVNTGGDPRTKGVITMIPTPQQFWNLYREELRKRGSKEAFESEPRWTALVTGIAKYVCEKMDLSLHPEYFRVDVIAYDGQGDDWWIRVAFEHENSPGWRDELCKLAHVVADLRILATFYDNGKEREPRSELQRAVTNLGERILRVPDAQWLFIFGPRRSDTETRFFAYTLDRNGQLQPLDEDEPLNPEDWYTPRSG